MSKTDFARRFRTGKRIRGTYCSLQYGRLPGTEPKAGVVVQTKAFPKAVERNRIRRSLTHYIQGLLETVHEPVFLVVIVYKRAPKEGLKQYRKEVATLVSKSGIIHL